MRFFARPADAQLAMLLERSDVRLVTVHGLSGSGTSTSVKHALGSALRIDLEGASRSEIRARLRAVSRAAEPVWIDQVHRPELAKAAIEALLERTRATVVVAARAPLHSAHEHRVPLGLFDLDATRALLGAELSRLGVHPLPPLDALATATDGWPLAALRAALDVRVLGPTATLDLALRPIVDEAMRGLPAGARVLLEALALARAPLDAHEADALVASARSPLRALDERGLSITDAGRVRVPRPVAACITPTPRAERLYTAWVLRTGERARAAHRREPVSRTAELEAIRADLVALALSSDPRTAVRAALALEPILVGRLARTEVLALWSHAARAADLLDDDARADVALAWARTSIARGDHETAEARLLETDALGVRAVHAAHRAVLLGHIAAWRGTLVRASELLDDATRLLAQESAEPLREDLLLQRIFVAHQRGDLDETERLGRACAAEAASRPSPRLLALTRRFMAEVALRRGQPRAAIPLLSESRADLTSFGDHAGALYLSSRLVEALHAAGEHEHAAREAESAGRLAARAAEGTLELTLLGALEGVAPARIAELAWRTQIPSLREEAERWLSQQAVTSIVLHLDHPTATASIEARALALERRPTLWRVLDALAEAHGRRAATSSEALFRAGWPGERVERASQRQRVQTAIWALRRGLLGERLLTSPEGYRLSPELRVERSL